MEPGFHGSATGSTLLSSQLRVLAIGPHSGQKGGRVSGLHKRPGLGILHHLADHAVGVGERDRATELFTAIQDFRQPDGSYYHSSGGVQEGNLEGPANADFDLELYKWSGGSWQRVAQSASYSSSEHIAYDGGEGYYYWAIVSYNGSGDYDFWLDRP